MRDPRFPSGWWLLPTILASVALWAWLFYVVVF